MIVSVATKTTAENHLRWYVGTENDDRDASRVSRLLLRDHADTTMHKSTTQRYNVADKRHKVTTKLHKKAAEMDKVTAKLHKMSNKRQKSYDAQN